jgi:peptidoglycan/LPS O-acetylase OafA/YrhL
MLYHLGALYLRDPSKPYLLDKINTGLIESITLSWAKYGWVGVQVFFVISGIVIAASVDGKTWWDYSRSRILRLYPGVWLCTGISMLCIIGSHQSDASTWLNLWIRSSVIFPFSPWVDGAYWTLPVEITFYSLMLLCIGRTPKMSIIIGVILCLMGAAFWSAYKLAPPDSTLYFWASKIAGKFRFDAAFIQYSIYFGLGILINRINSPIGKISVLAACSPICLIQISQTAQHGADYLNTPLSGLTPFAIWICTTLLIIASIEWNDDLLKRANQSTKNIIRRIGLTTYPLYLTHVTVSFATINISSHLGFTSLLSWTLGLCTPIILSIWIADQLEPAIRRKTASIIDSISTKWR